MHNKYSSSEPLPLIVLISGNGSNLQAIIDAIANGLPAKICAVISDNANAFGLERAEKANIPVHALSYHDCISRVDFEAKLLAIITAYPAQLIILAGFMRVLSKKFMQQIKQPMLNIHPSLLPNYPGLRTHARVLAAKDEYHGASVHLVTEVLDGGPIIAQSRLAVLANDTVETLQQRVQQLEHALYPEVIRWYAAGILCLADNFAELTTGDRLPKLCYLGKP